MKILSFTYVLSGIIFSIAAHSQEMKLAIPDCVNSQNHDWEICHHYFAKEQIHIASLGVPCNSDIKILLVYPGINLYGTLHEMEVKSGFCLRDKPTILPLPELKKEVELVIQILEKKANGDWSVSKQIPIKIYPKNILDPLRKLTEKHSIVVYDNDRKLTKFLEQKKINHIVGFGTLLGTPMALFSGVDYPEKYLQGSSLKTAIIFHEKVIDLPQIRVLSNQNKTRVYVEMKILNRLATSPLVQKALMKIFQLALKPNQNERRIK